MYKFVGFFYDYGQNGVELKNNIKRYWWDAMTLLHENIVGIDSAIFMIYAVRMLELLFSGRIPGRLLS